MTLREFWRRITSTRYTRALEAKHLEMRGEIGRHYRELARGQAALMRERAETTRQRAEVARQRAENLRLRAENRALLNSILGIAGIPPILVAAPEPDEISGASLPDLAELVTSDGVAPRAGDAAAHDSPLVADASLYASAGDSMHPDSLPSPDKPTSPAGKPDSPAPRSSLFGSLRTPHEPGESHVAAHIPSAAVNPPSMERARQRIPRNAQSPRSTHSPVATRRRSWHQINRMLEFESARKTVADES